MLVALSLTLLGVLGVFSVILGGTWSGIGGGSLVSETVLVNGTATTLEYVQDWSFSITELEGAIGWLTAIVGLVAVIGIRLFGSGLSDQTVRITTLVIVYSSIWTLLSIPAFPLITSIEIFGPLIYIVLTIGYAVGVIQNFDSEP